MFTLVAITWSKHEHSILLLAGAVCLLGSLSLFLVLQRSLEFGQRRRRQWSAISAVTGGVGVWATHFLAMLAHHHGIAMQFDAVPTAFSILVVIALFWIALRPLSRRRDIRSALHAGVCASAGVGLMHFVGMAAMNGADIHYDWKPISFSIGLSILFFDCAFLLFIYLSGWRQVVMPTVAAVFSVLSLHFGAMAATTIVMSHHSAALPGFDRTWLVAAILAATTLLLIGTAIAFVIDRYLYDLKGLAAATLEGLAIVHDERIIEANGQFAALLNVEPRKLVGSNPRDWLTPTDGLALLVERSMPLEAIMTKTDAANRIFEAATHGIEYRGRDCIVLALRDMTKERAAQRQIEHMARHDPLTDLPNRTLLDERIAHGIALADRDDQSLALIALDLDRFKAINDLFGHAAGDQLLCRVATILVEAVRATDTVARIGGDEFVILQVGASQPQGSQALIDRILDTFAREMDVARDPMAIGVSIGAAIYPDDADTIAGLRHGADTALYRAKASGRGVASFFDQAMDKAARDRRALEHDLRHAVMRQQLHVVYQPLVTSIDGQIAGYEALMRWTHPQIGEVPPDKFVPIAEETGSIVQLGEWILREACATAARWPAHLSLAINISTVQFQVANLPETIASILVETDLAPTRLELEITESALMKDRDAALLLLCRLKAIGISIVIDDFGTGYSSLSNLRSFPFDKIKIDRSFIAATDGDDAARSMIRAIVGIGKSLRLPVVAEGVETRSQHRMIVEEGCAQAQGFLFGVPDRMDARTPRAAAM